MTTDPFPTTSEYVVLGPCRPELAAGTQTGQAD